MNIIIKAAQFASKAHQDQVRKYTNAPYITHPGRVAARVMTLTNWTAPTLENMTVAAWLHDVIEDTDYTALELLDEFPSAAISIVVDLTNRFTKERHPDLNRADRKKLEFERLSLAPLTVKTIKLIDRIDNLSEIPPFGDFRRVYEKESIALLQALKGTDASLETELADLLLSELTASPK